MKMRVLWNYVSATEDPMYLPPLMPISIMGIIMIVSVLASCVSLVMSIVTVSAAYNYTKVVGLQICT